MSTKHQNTDYWKAISVKKIEEYWNSPLANARSSWFCEQLKQFSFDSIFECGYLSGRNLDYIRQAFPDVRISGLEINPDAIEYAKEKTKDKDIGLFEMDIYDLNSVVEKSDIVFTMGVLIHIVPEDIKNVLEKMIASSSKYVINIEDIGPRDLLVGSANANPKLGVGTQWQWNVDLVQEYGNLGYSADVISLPNEVRTNGASSMVIVKVK
jgi:SAM-dependent methyltransferase